MLFTVIQSLAVAIDSKKSNLPDAVLTLVRTSNTESNFFVGPWDEGNT